MYPHWHFITHSTSMNLFSMCICREWRSSWSSGSIELLSHKSYPYSMKSYKLPEFKGQSNSTWIIGMKMFKVSNMIYWNSVSFDGMMEHTCIVDDTKGTQHIFLLWHRPQTFGRYNLRDTHGPKRSLDWPFLWELRHSCPF